METNKKAVDKTGGDFDFALYDEAGNKVKDFDCVVMKRKLQAIVQERTKDMSSNELLDYFNKKSENYVFV